MHVMYVTTHAMQIRRSRISRAYIYCLLVSLNNEACIHSV